MLSRVDLNKGWAQYLLHRMGYVKRKATTKAKVTVENFAAVKEDYLLEIKQVITMDEIPADLIINFDQTGLSIVPSSDWTMEAKGAKRVEAVGKDDKRQLTAVLAGSLTGDLLLVISCHLRLYIRGKLHVAYRSTVSLRNGT